MMGQREYMAKNIVLFISLTILVISLVWVYVQPGFDSIITFLASVGGIITSCFMKIAQTETTQQKFPISADATLSELQVDRRIAEELNLENYLQRSGERLFWGDSARLQV